MSRAYGYVGPPELLERASPDTVGERVASPADLKRWLAGRDAAERDEPFTYVVDLDGTLRVAPRRSEHVACAGGQSVLAAGEVTFHGTRVGEISNQSTGYCPDAASWPDVAAALDRAGLDRPDGFTAVFVFRHCPGCGELNVVKDDDYVCVFCAGALRRS
ncbi:hypothetical protein [Actinomadura fibrosa]|uniref:Uncharacterized protein n=1 Tax=Actinomadura fibrosa TaxID=111802 RepID=A0ABW2XMH8_9ACTN|nr:hypothetical protein [Actinomadura fibrosa]